jgi:hypothetical protein
MKRKTIALGGIVVVLAVMGLGLWQPATASELAQAVIRRFNFPAEYRAGNSGAAFTVRQDGSGSVADFKDGSTSEYTFDQTSATFVNQLNLSDDLKIGNGTPGVTLNGEDAYIEGTLEVDGAVNFGGVVTMAGGGLDTLIHASQAFTYTAAAGGTVPLFTIPDGQTWLIHDVKINVTSNWNCTGDDCVVEIGDDLDVDGFCTLADATLQAADTELTGYPAGWQCAAAATRGVYLDEVTTNAYTGGLIYVRAGSAQTIDAKISASGNDLSAGAATAHIFYTRIQ